MPSDNLESIADSIGSVTDEQEPDDNNRLQTDDFEKRDMDEYQGAFDTEQ
jgi:hypothetical protein